jgi:protein-S-isoprenylcysteine O-methyltransferase Ste14
LIVFLPRFLLMIYLVLWVLLLVVEPVLVIRRRSKAGQAPEDRGFRALASFVFVTSNLAAIVCLRLFPAESLGGYGTSSIGLALMLAGLLLRWWSIIHLGRFFTKDVVIASDHRLVDSGPYKLIRHPSYTGLLIFIVGVAFCFGNLVSALVLLVPFAALMLRRMRIEEAALSRALGDAYSSYTNRTKRLIPGIY